MSIAEENHFSIDLELLEESGAEHEPEHAPKTGGSAKGTPVPEVVEESGTQEQRLAAQAKAQRDAQNRAKRLAAQVKKLNIGEEVGGQ